MYRHRKEEIDKQIYKKETKTKKQKQIKQKQKQKQRKKKIYRYGTR